MRIKVQTYTSEPPVFNNNGVLCLFYLERKSHEEGVVCVHESFWKGLENESNEDQDLLQKQMIEYLIDQENYNDDPNHPLKNNFEAYKAYCELKYGKLNRYQNKLISAIMAPIWKDTLHNSKDISKVIDDLNLSDTDKLKVNEALEKFGDPNKLRKLLNND